MSQIENNTQIAFDEFDLTIDLSIVPEQEKWIPNDILIIENQPVLTFPFIPSFKQSEPEEVPAKTPVFVK